MPRFKTMRQIPFPFKRIFGRTVLPFTKLKLTVRCNFQLCSGFILTSVNSATHRKTILSGRACISSGKHPEGEGHYPEICSQAPAIIQELSLTSPSELEIRCSPELPQKYAPDLPRTLCPSLDYGCLPVLRPVETWLSKLNSPQTRRAAGLRCREASPSTLAYRTKCAGADDLPPGHYNTPKLRKLRFLRPGNRQGPQNSDPSETVTMMCKGIRLPNSLVTVSAGPTNVVALTTRSPVRGAPEPLCRYRLRLLGRLYRSPGCPGASCARSVLTLSKPTDTTMVWF